MAEWSVVDWESVSLMLRDPPHHAGVLAPLLQLAVDTIGVPASTLCASAGACAAGLFALRVMAVSALLREGHLVSAEARSLIEPAASNFTAAFGRLLGGKKTLQEEFGDDRKEPLALHDVALHSFGRLLYTLAGLPRPVGPEDPVGQFEFGANWLQFLEHGRVTRRGLVSAVQEARRALGGALGSLQGLHVLDLGCGSGLQSLAFRLLGAHVTSVDIQQPAVEATKQLRAAFSDEANWSTAQCSALDVLGLARLTSADVVYTWGVLHHSGN